MNSKILKVLSYVAVALLSCALTLTCVFLSVSDSQGKLEELENLIDSVFIGEWDKAAAEDSAAAAMVESLGDRWSYYMTAEAYQSYVQQMANSYVGVGITVQLNGDGLGMDVVQVTSGGPAEEAGIIYGDIITGVDGTSIAGMTLTDAGNLIKGAEGTTVVLTLSREGERLDVTVERRQIQTAVATARMLEDGIGLVTIVNFDSRCASETIAAIEELLDQGAEKLIFDVRYNPGGYKKELVEVLNYLLPEGLLFRSEYYDGTVEEDLSDAACLDIPMAVLVNGSSYSAAEFFAAALSEYDAAVTVGTQTCGKGYFQNTFRLDDGSAVCISVGKYYTPNGVSLAEVGGLVPDVVVEVDSETASAIYAGVLEPMEDPQILAAIDALKSK